jgi:hypothetical protein
MGEKDYFCEHPTLQKYHASDVATGWLQLLLLFWSLCKDCVQEQQTRRQNIPQEWEKQSPFG